METYSTQHEDTPVKLMLYPAIIFMVIGMFIGTFMAFNTFVYPDYFSGRILHFGRVRPVHVWSVLLLWLLSANVGLLYYFVPRLCGVRLWSPKMAYWSIGCWWFCLVIGTYTFPLGTNFGWEYAELPLFLGRLPIKPFLLVAWLLLAINLYMTIATRKYEKMYVSLWYTMGVLFWAGFNFVIGGYVVNMVPEGISRVNTSFFYVHNLVGLIFTPMGLAAAYYYLPKLTGRPIYSHTMSMVGFWSISFVYAWIGAHHILHGPVPQWLQTTAIIFSIWLFIPVWTVVGNLFASMSGHWKQYYRKRSSTLFTCR